MPVRPKEPRVQCSIIHKGLNMESTCQCMKKRKGVVYRHNGRLFSFLKEGNSTIHNDKDEPNEPYAKNNASNT